jgi:serine/threonine-protein kinase
MSITSRLSTAVAERYKLERHLGEGGMATVYLAEDLKHDRKVALKVLKPELAAVLGAERFVQEIKTTASLQHPNILPLFDSGEADGFLYYVMPFIEGETLRDKLNRETQLGIEEAVGITTDIADALDYAHRHNVIHRDIKPENILLHDGRPMVADGRMTETGLSLGTPHYMSPEQATAEKDLTNRSDIYSLGSVLYEMLTGEPPHTGGSAQAIIMKIVTEPAVTRIRKSVPPHVAAATAKSLEKLAADRFGSAAKFAEALTNPAFTLPQTGVTSVAGAPVRGLWNPLSAGVTVFAAAMTLAALWGWLRPQPEVPMPVSRYSVAIPEEEALFTGFGSRVAVSPDGSRLVYVGAGEQNSRLLVRDLDQLHATPLAGTEGAQHPFFSPDGSRVGFFAQGYEWRAASLGGGPPITIACGRRWWYTGGRDDDGYHAGGNSALLARGASRWTRCRVLGATRREREPHRVGHRGGRSCDGHAQRVSAGGAGAVCRVGAPLVRDGRRDADGGAV